MGLRPPSTYLCRVLRNDTLMELGKEFGMTGYSPAGRAVARVKKKLAKDKRLQKRLGLIKQTLLTPKDD